MNTINTSSLTLPSVTIQSATASAPFMLLAGINLDAIPSGHRLIRVTYRNDSNAAKDIGKKESQGVIVQVISHADVCTAMNAHTMPDTMIAWVSSHMAKIQDEIARNSYESQVASGITKPSLEYADISITAINKAIDSKVNAERVAAFRLSKAAISEWYIATLSPLLAQLFSDRLGLPTDSRKIVGILDAYNQSFQLLAGRNPLDMDKATNLIKALDMIPSSHASIESTDMMTSKLLERIELLTSMDDDSLMMNI